jgi:hypothetical protein
LRDLEIAARRANLAGVRRLGRSWRWAVVVAGVAVLAAIPAVVGALPVRATAVEPEQLASAIVGSAAAPYQGYVETRGQLGLPDLPDVDTATALLGGPAKIRVWRASPTAWRVDLLNTTGETDTYGDATGTWTWDSNDRRVARVEQAPGDVRLPRPADVVPPELGRRLVGGAAPGELQAIAPARVAGVSVPGLRIVPADPVSTVDHVDLWADAGTGVVLRVAVVSRGADRPVFESQFLDVSLSRPADHMVMFVRPAGVRNRRNANTDLLLQLRSITSSVQLPASLAGLARAPGQTGGIATYGDGFGVVTVVAVPSFLISDAIPPTFPLTDRPWGGQARVVETQLVNAMAMSSGSLGYVLTGAVTVPELDRVAAVINELRPGQ